MQHKNERKRKHSTHTHPKKTHTKWNEWDIFFVFMFYFISVFGGDGGNGSSGNDDGGCYISGCSFLFCILCKTILCFKRMDILELQGKREKKICGMEFHSAKAALIIFLWILGCNLSLDLKLKNCSLQNWYTVYVVFCACFVSRILLSSENCDDDDL